MPRNQILPPVSFVTDLSNRGDRQIQNLLEVRLEQTDRAELPSFSERLRKQPVSSKRTEQRAATTYEPAEIKNKTRLPTRLSRPEVIEKPQPLRSSARGQEVSQRIDSKIQTRAIQQPDESSQPKVITEAVVPVETEQPVSGAKESAINIEQPTEKNIQTEPVPELSLEKQVPEGVILASEIPPALLQHVLQNKNPQIQNEQGVDSESLDKNSEQPIATLPRLTIALQGNYLPSTNEQSITEAQVLESIPVEEPEQINSSELIAELQVVPEVLNDQREQQEAQQPVQVAAVVVTDSVIPSQEDIPEQIANLDSPELNIEAVPAEAVPAEAERLDARSFQNEIAVDQNRQTEQKAESQTPLDSTILTQPVENLVEQNKQAVQHVDANKPEQPAPDSDDEVSPELASNIQQLNSANVEVDSEIASTEKLEAISQPTESEPETDENVKSAQAVASQSSQPRFQSSPPNNVTTAQNENRISSLEQTLSAPESMQAATGLAATASSATMGSTGEVIESRQVVQAESVTVAATSASRSSADSAPVVQPRPVLDMTRPDVSQKLTVLMQQAADSGKPLRVRLNPPELGTLQIEVGRFQGQIVARVEVENQTTRALVMEQLQILRDSLQQQGLKIDRVDVELNENLSKQFSSDQSQEQRSNEHQHNTEDSNYGTENSGQASQEEGDEKSPVTQIHGVSEIDVRI